MGMRAQRVAQEDHELDLTCGDLGTDLQVAAEGSGSKALHSQTGLLGDQAAGRARGDQLLTVEGVAVLLDELEHRCLLRVVSDQGNRTAAER